MEKQDRIEEDNKENIEMTEEILSGKTRLIDLVDYKTKNYMKCKGIYAEIIEGRTRVAFVRCPKCRSYISIYLDELRDENGHTRQKKCLCGFFKSFELIDWKKK